MKQVTKDMTIGEILRMDQDTVPVFLSFGMHCLGCPHSQGESVEMACAVHGINADEMIAKLNEVLAAKA